MSTLQVNTVLKDKILVSRESAHLLEDPLRVLISSAEPRDQPTVIDFAGVEGIAPSFVDELISILDSLVRGRAGRPILIIAHPPTRLSSKFEAIARGHQMSVRALPDGNWVFAQSEESLP